MSNYTNKDIYVHNNHVLPYVGINQGISHDNNYIKNQLNLINDSRNSLPPKVNFPGSNINKNKKNVNDLQSLLNGTTSEINEPIGITPGKRLNTYEPLKSDRYDPYVGYLYKNGLLEDSGVYRFTSHNININSAHRNKLPTADVDNIINLGKNPLELKKKSNQLIILHSNSGFKVNDRIILTGAGVPVITLRSKIGNNYGYELSNGSSLLKIYYTHGIDASYNTNDIIVTIDGIRGNTTSTAVQNSYFDNISVNLMNKTHTVQLATANSNFGTIFTPTFDTNGNVTNSSSLDTDAFYVDIGRLYTGTFSTSINPLAPYNFTIKFPQIGNIPLNLINAEYPIDINHLQGFHIIKTILFGGIGYTVELSKKSLFDISNVGGSNIKVGKINKINTGYSRPNHYKIELGNVFYNVISARLVSSEFPNTRLAIRNSNGSANNKLHWNNLDDGDYIYSIEVEPGNYTPAELVSELQNKFIETERINFAIDNDPNIVTNTPPYTNKHLFNITISTTTNIVTFSSLREAVLERPIYNTDPVINQNTDINTFNSIIKVTIEHANHGLSVGDTILISNAIAHYGIVASVLNGEHKIIELDSTDPINRYKIELPKFNLITSSAESDTKGGLAVTIFSPNTFRLRFDQEDSIGDLLGFRNVGNSTSVYGYASSIKNSDPYEFEQSVNAFGITKKIKQNFLQLSGDDYFLMVTDKIENITCTGPIKSAFAKVILCDIPGKTLYNSFINLVKIRKEQLEELSELEFTFYAPDGTLFNFQDIDHSFVIEITTIEELPKGSNISAHSGRVNFQGTIN